MKDFTAQQREVVARKLGYEGPMQGFDQFISSSPALEAKYAAIAGKFAERMAKGGLVKMKRKPKGYAYGGPIYTDEEFFQQTGSWEEAAALRDAQNNAINQANWADAAAARDAENRAAIAARDAANQAEVAAAQARGGVTNAVVAEWWSDPKNQALSDAQIKTIMDANKVTPQQFAEAIGANSVTAADIQNRYDIAGMPVTTAPPTTAPITTAPITTAPVTTRPITTAPITTAPVTTRPITTAPVTTSPSTTAFTGGGGGGGVTGGGNVTFTPVGGVPQAAAASAVQAEKVVTNANQDISTTARAGTASTIDGSTPAAVTLATVPTTTPTVTMSATAVAPTLQTELDKLKPAAGTLTTEATVSPEELWTTALTAARKNTPQIETAQKVAVVPDRTLGAAETITGSAVDMTKVNTELAKAEAAQGTVTEDMTVQGQLTKLTKNFDATNPPPWAAGALRAVTAEMSARGLGASSLAGAALVQAALEKALPIASADATTYQQMATQNLSNRQQIAVLTAQQRATFLGQEFDQNFQTRVVNAARVADIANMNFNAAQQVALENSRLAQSVDLANLNSRQAAFMAELAQTATLETASLNNRQQAAVVNAQSALQIDLTNMSYEQQTAVLKTQLKAQALLSDAAADNAAKQFNAASTNQTNQFFASLISQVSQFNSAQSNAMEQFKVDQANSVKKFNAEVTNQREQFNAQQRLLIDQSNAQWQRDIATINTGAVNSINMQNAQLAQQMTLSEYNNQIQMYRDSVSHAWTSAENDANRATTLAAEEIRAAAAIAGANIKADSDSSTALGSFVGRVLVGVATGGIIK